MKLRVDRLEGEYVVCEDCNSSEIINLDRAIFSEEIHSGDLIELTDNTVTILPNDDVKKRIREKMNKLWM